MIINKSINAKEIDPLGVLLDLLGKESLEISNFSLAQVADKYLEYLSDFRDQREILDNISEFLWVASKLALLKSKILISTFEFNEEEVEEEGDLKDRLLKYQKIKEISQLLKDKSENSLGLFTKESQRLTNPELSIKFGVDDLRVAFRRAVDIYKDESDIIYNKKEIGEVIKIEERIEKIKKILNKTKKFKFSDIVFKKSSRTEVVVSFLSVLELVKQGTIDINQAGCFQEIDIARRSDE